MRRMMLFILISLMFSLEADASLVTVVSGKDGSQSQEKLFENLISKPDAVFMAPDEDNHSMGSSLTAKFKGENWERITEKNALKYFEPIDNEQKAIELCLLLNWGTIIRSNDQFKRVVDLNKKFNYPTEFSADNYLCSRNNTRCDSSQMVFDIVVNKKAGGFEVSYTAYILGKVMGASADLERVTYLIKPDNSLELVERVIYLPGPVLNWQTSTYMGGNCDDAFLRERKKIIRGEWEKQKERDDMIEGVYSISPEFIPKIIHQKARDKKVVLTDDYQEPNLSCKDFYPLDLKNSL